MHIDWARIYAAGWRARRMSANPPDRSRSPNGTLTFRPTQVITFAMTAFLTLGTVLAMVSRPPLKGWLFCIPWGIVLMLASGWALRQARRQVTTDKTGDNESVIQVGFAIWKAIASVIAIFGAVTLMLTVVNGSPSPQKIPRMFTLAPCSTVRAGINLDPRPQTSDDTQIVSATVFISRPPHDGETLWIVVYSYSSTPMAFFAKKELSDLETTQGQHPDIQVVLHTTDPNGRRDFFIACTATTDGHAWLEQNQQNDVANSSWNTYRRALPDDVIPVSARAPYPPPP